MTRFSSGFVVALLSGFGALACGGQASGGPDGNNGGGGWDPVGTLQAAE